MKSLLAGLIGVGFLVGAWAQDGSHKPQSDHILLTPDELKWVDGPAALPPGAKLAILEADPKKPGLFTMRVRLPADYKVAPHWHPADEHVTVISGAFHMGLGEKFDSASAKALTAGGFGMMPAKTPHFAFTKEETVIQVHAMGPWEINYVNPADDPRKK